MGLKSFFNGLSARRRARVQFDQLRNSISPARGFRLSWEDRWLCLNDATNATEFDRHYVLHTSWAARRLRSLAPAIHTDISSSLYFAGIASAFVPIRFYDYRPVDLGLTGLDSGKADLVDLPFPNNSLPTLSCMHVIEHVGLGRYGDPLDPDGDLKALSELQRVVAPGGSLLLVVPVGEPRIQFNAHRIYSVDQVLKALPSMQLADFALIEDYENGPLLEGLEHISKANRCHYGCGCFHFVKLAPSP